MSALRCKGFGDPRRGWIFTRSVSAREEGRGRFPVAQELNRLELAENTRRAAWGSLRTQSALTEREQAHDNEPGKAARPTPNSRVAVTRARAPRSVSAQPGEQP